MSLAWRVAAGYYKQTGIKHDSPDLDQDPAFDLAFDHVSAAHSRGRFGVGEECPSCATKPTSFDLSKPLHGNETSFDGAAIEQYKKNPIRGDGSLPILMKYQGEHHIIDGHHRLSAHILRGDTHAPVFEYDADHFLSHPDQHNAVEQYVPPKEDQE